MRTFVAIEINDKNLLEQIQKMQSKLEINAKPVSLENMHFTLFFLGEITSEMSEKIKQILNSIVFSSFQITFSKIGVFPKPKFPRIIWIGIDEKGAKQLNLIAREVQEKLSALGFKQDKPFKPHVTIFRIKNKIGDISDKLAQLTISGNQRISALKFKKSVLSSNGPIYTDLQVIKAKNETNS